MVLGVLVAADLAQLASQLGHPETPEEAVRTPDRVRLVPERLVHPRKHQRVRHLLRGLGDQVSK